MNTADNAADIARKNADLRRRGKAFLADFLVSGLHQTLIGEGWPSAVDTPTDRLCWAIREAIMETDAPCYVVTRDGWRYLARLPMGAYID